MATHRLKELQRKQQIEDAKENLVNGGDSAESKDIPSVRVNDRVTPSVNSLVNSSSPEALPSSTPTSPRAASPLVNGESSGRGGSVNGESSGRGGSVNGESSGRGGSVNGESSGRGGSCRDPTSAPHLLEPRANSLPRNVKGLNSRRGSGDGGGASSCDEDGRSVSLAQYRLVGGKWVGRFMWRNTGWWKMGRWCFMWRNTG